jgi:uncharacterized protein
MKNKIVFKSVEAQLSGDNFVEGHAAIFGNIDSHNDIVVKGAFRKSLQSGRKTRFLFDHDPAKAIGRVDHLAEDGKGLAFRAEFSKNQMAQEVRQDLKDGVLDSFSIGYRPIISNADKVNGRSVNLLKEIALYEISVVSIPSNEQAVLTAVKSSGILSQEHQELVERFAQFLVEETKGIDSKELEETEEDELDLIASLLVKAGARHSAADRTQLNAIRDAITGLLDDGDGDEDADQEDNMPASTEGALDECNPMGDQIAGWNEDMIGKALDEAVLTLKLDELKRALTR